MTFQDATWKERAVEAKRIADETVRAQSRLESANRLAQYCKKLDAALVGIEVPTTFTQADLIDTGIYLDRYQGNERLNPILPVSEDVGFVLGPNDDLYIIKKCPKCGAWRVPDMYHTYIIRSQQDLGTALVEPLRCGCK